jgi:hypothetical protein
LAIISSISKAGNRRTKEQLSASANYLVIDDINLQNERNLTREGGEPSLRNLHVVLGGIEARPNASDDLAIDDNRKATLHLDETTRGDGRDPAVIDGVFQRLTRFLEQCGGSGLAGCELDAGNKGLSYPSAPAGSATRRHRPQL